MHPAMKKAATFPFGFRPRSRVISRNRVRNTVREELPAHMESMYVLIVSPEMVEIYILAPSELIG